MYRLCNGSTHARGVTGIPRVVIVVTDGVASTGFEPDAEAALLQAMGVTIFAIGVGNGVDVPQLQVGCPHVSLMDAMRSPMKCMRDKWCACRRV